jgi:polysaccharide export outer membrane protein
MKTRFTNRLTMSAMLLTALAVGPTTSSGQFSALMGDNARSGVQPACGCGQPNCGCQRASLVHSLHKSPTVNDLQTCCPPKVITGVDSKDCLGCGEPTWSLRGPLPFDLFSQGEYVGPCRTPHVRQYRLRPTDQVELIFRLTRERTSQPYKLNVGDEVRIESLADDKLDRQLDIQPDGSVTLRLLGQVLAAGRTTDQLRRDLEKRYKKYYRVPSITVTPTRVNTRLEDLRATIDNRQGIGGQSSLVTVAPDGTVALPGLGSVRAQCLTLDELGQEINARYSTFIDGIEVTPVLSQRAPRFIFVLGEVVAGGRFEMTGPTTVTQALALAQGWNIGGNLRQIVIFRRAHDWRLMATKVDIRGAVFGKSPIPSDEIWLRDGDVVIVPKSPVKTAVDVIDLVFTRGIYAVAPILGEAFFYQDAVVSETINTAAVTGGTSP